MISKSELFYCHTYRFDASGDVVEGWREGEFVHTTYVGLPGLCVTLTSITGKDFTNVSAIMG